MNFDEFKVIEIRKVEDEYKRAKLKDASAKIVSIICTVVMLMNASVNNFKTDTFKNLLLFDEVALLQGVVLVLNKYKKERKLEKLYDLLGIEEEERIWSKQWFIWKKKKNIELWNILDKEYERVKSLVKNIKFTHVRGHQDCFGNNLADELASNASLELIE